MFLGWDLEEDFYFVRLGVASPSRSCKASKDYNGKFSCSLCLCFVALDMAENGYVYLVYKLICLLLLICAFMANDPL